jgi:predicted MFS family arabinose efflux permease
MIPRRTVWVMAVGCGLSVANLYYNQPLLVQMARSFGVPAPRTGLVATLSQVGYALGLLLFVPLGDLLERRSFVTAMLGAVTLALLAVAVAPGFAWLAAASLVLGATTVVPQVLIPFAAGLASPAERGRVVGTVMGGLLIGVLSARTVSGFVGTYFGWRAMYLVAAALMVALAVAMRLLLPRGTPALSGISYPALLRSTWGLFRVESVLRQSCLFGATGFGAFSAFWTTLAFYLAGPPFGYGGDVAGLFGLIGVVGALAAPLVGRLADRRSPRFTIALGLGCMLAAFAVLYGLGDQLWGLAVGVVLLDLGAQTNHISNQARIYGLRAEAHSRLNTAYMVAFFLGGSLGSYAASRAWGRLGWAGVCLVGASFLLLGLAGFAGTAGERRPSGARRASPAPGSVASPD